MTARRQLFLLHVAMVVAAEMSCVPKIKMAATEKCIARKTHNESNGFLQQDAGQQ